MLGGIVFLLLYLNKNEGHGIGGIGGHWEFYCIWIKTREIMVVQY